MHDELIDIDRALTIVLDHAVPLPAETVPAAGADGRYVAEPVLAAIDLPPFTNSAMDGFALRAADTPGRLAIVGESAAGRPFAGVVGRGEAVVISTGAVLPDGADGVVPVELAARTGGAVLVPDAVAPRNAIRDRASDIAAGRQVVAAGTRLDPPRIGAIIAAGVASVRCGRRPRVAILTTGDELRPPGTALGPGEIHDSNGPMLAAALIRHGAIVTRIDAAADTPDAHREALGRALEHDVVISTGGVSVGPHDIVRRIGAQLGVTELFWRIRMRPGKPLSFGVRGRTLVFGLPGNPVSAIVCGELFVAPAVAALQGGTDPRPQFGRGRLATPVTRNPDRDDLIRVRRDAGGELVPAAGQQSHQITITAMADGLARIPAGRGELAAGTEVAYLPLVGGG